MAVYRTTSCPHCKQPIKFLERTGWNDIHSHIGSPAENCFNCGKPYKTGKNHWSQLPRRIQFLIYFKLYFSITYTAAAYTLLVGIAMHALGEYLYIDLFSNRIDLVEEDPWKILFVFVPLFIIARFTQKTEFFELKKQYP